MEAVPRLPMISFDLKISPENPSFGPKLKQYIAEFYHEDPDSYSNEIHALEGLRAAAVRPARDVTGCSVLKRYFAQLHALQGRFPLGKGQSAAITFSWRDVYASMVCSVADIRLEMASILYNIGALHTQLGALDTRGSADGMKIACTHFQCAAWAFQHLKEVFPQPPGDDLSTEVMGFMHSLCLAQAQECILEKSMADNRKATIVAKVAIQVVDYYNQSMAGLLAGGEDGAVADTIGSRAFKEWKKYIQFKIAYCGCVALLYQGQQAEEQQKMGERVAYYQAAFNKLEEARKLSKGMDHAEAIAEALSFTNDVVEGKRKAARNENEFIYHEEVPELSTLAQIKGASLVKGIPFSVTDPEVLGDDIFKRLVPMKAHEASSLYSEEKARLLRDVANRIEDSDFHLQSFLSSLQLQGMNTIPESLPQGVIDRCAALSARPGAVQELVNAMDGLADTCCDVQGNLQEIQQLLEEEEIREKIYQKTMGSRPMNGVITELTREFSKYMEAHAKAGGSNETLRRAMGLHVSNLKILSLSLNEVKAALPKLSDSDVLDESSKLHLQTILNKVDEMRTQRSTLHNKLREAARSDDITDRLIAWGEKPIDILFSQEIKKHEELVVLIDQNLSAQDNILKALTEAYARCAVYMKAQAELIRKRDMFNGGLIASYDTYEDLLGKTSKGIDFYKKLQLNVGKLLARVRSACNVQEEERTQRIQAKGGVKIDTPPEKTSRTGPKLRDYLAAGLGTDSTRIPSIRPSPLGSEGTSEAACTSVDQGKNLNMPYFQKNQNYQGYDNTLNNVNTQVYNAGSYGNQTYNSQYSSNLPDTSSEPYSANITQIAAHNNVAPSESFIYNNYTSYSTGANPQNTTTTVSDSKGYGSNYYAGLNTNYSNKENSYTSVSQNPIASSNSIGYMPQNHSAMQNIQQLPESTTNQTYPTATNQQGYYQYPASNSANQVYQNTDQSPIPSNTVLPQAYIPTNETYLPNTADVNQQYLSTGLSSSGYSTANIPANSAYTNASINSAVNPAQYPASIQQYQPTNIANFQQYESVSNNQIYSGGKALSDSQQHLASNVAGNVQYVQPSNKQMYGSNIQESLYNTQLQNQSGQNLSSGFDQSVSGITQQMTDLTVQGYDQKNYQYSTYNYQLPQLNQEHTGYNPYGATSLLDPSAVKQSTSANPNASIVAASVSNLAQSQSYSGHPGYALDPKTGAYQYFSGYQAQQNQYSQNNVSHNQVNYSGQSTWTPDMSYYSNAGSNPTNNTLSSETGVQGQTYAYQYSLPGASNQPGSSYYTTPYGGEAAGNFESTNAPQSPMTYMHASNTATTTTNSQIQEKNDVSNYLPANNEVEKSNIDLLAGLDFSPAVPTLTPQQTVPKASGSKNLKSADISDGNVSVNNISNEKNEIKSEPMVQETKVEKYRKDIVDSKPATQFVDEKMENELHDNIHSNSKLDEADNIQVDDDLTPPSGDDLGYFLQEVERLDKFMDGISTKTLNGPTPLETKWKELQDIQLRDAHNRSISVARCYPAKNRCPDILPYDQTRIPMPSTKDDYINASLIKNITERSPHFIITQSPMMSTKQDFWKMVLEQNVEVIVCLLTVDEVDVPYFPSDKVRPESVGDILISLRTTNVRRFCTERVLSVKQHRDRPSKDLLHLQVNEPIKSAITLSGVASEIVAAYNSQRSRSHPILLHCLTGAGISGEVCLTICSVLAANSNKPGFIDIVSAASKMCCQRKHSLQDRQDLLLIFHAALHYSKEILNAYGILTSRQIQAANIKQPSTPPPNVINDPLSELDPMWRINK